MLTLNSLRVREAQAVVSKKGNFKRENVIILISFGLKWFDSWIKS